MSKRTYMYSIGLKRGDRDLVIDGIIEFLVFKDDGGISVVSTRPPFVRVKVENDADVDRVVDYWWRLFVNRMDKFSSGKTIVKPIRIVRVEEKNEGSERD